MLGIEVSEVSFITEVVSPTSAALRWYYLCRSFLFAAFKRSIDRCVYVLENVAGACR